WFCGAFPTRLWAGPGRVPAAALRTPLQMLRTGLAWHLRLPPTCVQRQFVRPVPPALPSGDGRQFHPMRPAPSDNRRGPPQRTACQAAAVASAVPVPRRAVRTRSVQLVSGASVFGEPAFANPAILFPGAVSAARLSPHAAPQPTHPAAIPGGAAVRVVA